MEIKYMLSNKSARTENVHDAEGDHHEELYDTLDEAKKDFRLDVGGDPGEWYCTHLCVVIVDRNGTIQDVDEIQQRTGRC